MKTRPIAMYHAVDTLPDPMSVQVTPARLRQQLEVLRRLDVQGVSVRELLEPATTSRRRVGLSFDDGYADFATTALPLLDEFGFTSTVYVVAGRLGGTNDWDPPPRRTLMSADEVRDVHLAGHEIGSHGMWHVRLDHAPDDELDRELVESRFILEEVIGARVHGFCYPYGAISPTAHAAVRDSYDYACAIRPTVPVDRWALPRFHVGERDGALRLLTKFALRPARERMRGRA